MHLLFDSASSVVLLFSSSFLLVSSGPSIGPAPSLEPLLFSLVLSGVSLSIVGWLSVFCCVPHLVFSSRRQTYPTINYPVQLLSAFFRAANSHALCLPLFSLVVLFLDGYNSNSLSVASCCCSQYISFVLFL